MQIPGVEKNYAKVLNDREQARQRGEGLYFYAIRACGWAVKWDERGLGGGEKIGKERTVRGHLMSSGWLGMTEGAGFSGRYANKPLPDVSGVRFGLKLLLASSGIIVLDEPFGTGASCRSNEPPFDSLGAFASGSLALSPQIPRVVLSFRFFAFFPWRVPMLAITKTRN